MDLAQHKINQYANGVSKLPDYPSDAGYTAEQLKAVFDSRSDNEIKNKHNSLIDTLATEWQPKLYEFAEHIASRDNPHRITSEQSGALLEVSMHDIDSTAHRELFDKVKDLIESGAVEKLNKTEFEVYKSAIEAVMHGKADLSLLDDYATKEELNDDVNSMQRWVHSEINLHDNDEYAHRYEFGQKVDKVEGKGLSTNDFTDEWKSDINNALKEAILARGEIENHSFDLANPHQVTAEQIGALTADSLNDEMGKYIPQLENDIGSLNERMEDVYTKAETRDVAYNVFVASTDYQDLLRNVRVLQEKDGDISTALDSILAIQNELIGG